METLMTPRWVPRKNRLSLVIGVMLWAAYAVLTLMAPLARNPYHLSLSERDWLQLTIILPVLVIWLLALNGAASFLRYARLIRDSKDGQALQLIAGGLLVLVLYYIFQSLLAPIPLYLAGRWQMFPALMLANHVPVALALAGFGMILAGAWKLRALTVRPLTRGGLTAIVFPYVLLGVVYGWLFYRQLPTMPDPNGIPRFAMPEQLTLLTVAFPYIAAWLLGILAITVIAEYARIIHGSIYRRALKDLVRGLTGVLGFSVLLQLLQLSSVVFTRLPLGAILLILYVLLVLYAVGFAFIARGAGKLSLIEESL